MEYRVRFVGAKGDWIIVEADTPEQAAQDFHFERWHWGGYNYWPRKEDSGKGVDVLFAWVEVERYGQFLSRIWMSRIRRKGGVSRFRTDKEQLRWIANQLGWEGKPEELLEPGWDGEEEEWR